MPFVIIAFGVILVAAGIRGTQGALFTLLKNDLTGFAPWFVSILVIGALGYVKSIKPITDGFMVLLIVVLFLSNGGFFAKLFGTAVDAKNPLTVFNAQGYQQTQGFNTLGGSLASYSSLN